MLDDINNIEKFQRITNVKKLFEEVYNPKTAGSDKVKEFLISFLENTIVLTKEKPLIGCFVSKLMALDSPEEKDDHPLVIKFLELLERIEKEQKTHPHGHGHV